MGKQQGPPPDYVEVSDRLQEWREKYPDGSIQADMVPSPFEGFVCVKAYAYRDREDTCPGTGLAWEPVPGKTNFTRDSELMNAETSAWGRAIVAVGAADAKRGVASANEVRGRQQPQEPPQQPAQANGKAKAPPELTPAQDFVKGLVADLDDEQKNVLKDWWRNQQLPAAFSDLSDEQCKAVQGQVDAVTGAPV